MTDNEIVEALNWCVHHLSHCADCPYFGGDTLTCHERLYCDTVGLIKRQQAEIERLKGYNENLQTANVALSNEILDIKAEAIKEFAERLKATFPSRDDARCTLDDCYTLDIIDNLVNEMTEELV